MVGASLTVIHRLVSSDGVAGVRQAIQAGVLVDRDEILAVATICWLTHLSRAGQRGRRRFLRTPFCGPHPEWITVLTTEHGVTAIEVITAASAAGLLQSLVAPSERRRGFVRRDLPLVGEFRH
jgi:hypothetical protein